MVIDHYGRTAGVEAAEMISITRRIFEQATDENVGRDVAAGVAHPIA
jgi:hypothetical protein